MTEDEHRVLVNYIRDSADVMGLKDWQFDLSQEPPGEDGRIAQMEVWGDSQTVTVWLAKNFFSYGPRMQRETIVHELVHCHTDKLFRRAKEIVRKTLGSDAYTVAVDSIEQSHEFVVDGIAAAWARFLPMIDWADQRPLYFDHETIMDRREGCAEEKGSTVD